MDRYIFLKRKHLPEVYTYCKYAMGIKFFSRMVSNGFINGIYVFKVGSGNGGENFRFGRKTRIQPARIPNTDSNFCKVSDKHSLSWNPNKKLA
jgi:hypothetical protein